MPGVRGTRTRKKRPAPSSHYRVRRSARSSGRNVDTEGKKSGGLAVGHDMLEHGLLATEELEQATEALRQFDMNFLFGPCVGMSRRRRWERAARFELHPPEQVSNILHDPAMQANSSDLDKDLWHKEML